MVRFLLSIQVVPRVDASAKAPEGVRRVPAAAHTSSLRCPVSPSRLTLVPAPASYHSRVPTYFADVESLWSSPRRSRAG